ncbi:MAG: 4Fe-4S binding protein [Candidatus Omnitrophica bacterium]|nr:4Fe-4S binding protein [Candidatus Omnitrophota bacterium]
MKIDGNKCKNCRQCIPYCPVQAIKDTPKGVCIDQDLCVECGVCYRSRICKSGALAPFSRRYSCKPIPFISRVTGRVLRILAGYTPGMTHLGSPRRIRETFSDPFTTSILTQISGRGTAEIKTNDVTGRYRPGEIGFCIEVGRPGIGATMKEVEQFTVALAQLGVYFEPDNPMTRLIRDTRGHLQKKYHEERVLSAIIECKVNFDDVGNIFELIKRLDRQTDTVFTVGVISTIDLHGETPVLEKIAEYGLCPSTHSKINVGLGIPSSEGDR